MAHHIEDKDPHFIIDPISRAISTECSKVCLIQGDHNSERFTFEIPREVEGHELPACDAVEIHFINIDQQTKEQSAGVYLATDVATTGDEAENIAFSWLISHQATKYMGALNFLIKFICYAEDGSVKYAWHSAIYKGISISSGLDCGEATVEDYNDILNEWKRTLEANQITKLEQTQEGDGDEGENIWTATFGDGRTSELRVKNGSRGPTGLVGSIETITGETLHFYVGPQADYDNIPESILNSGNLLALFTDDTTDADIKQAAEEAVEIAAQAQASANASLKMLTPPSTNAAETKAVYPVGTLMTLKTTVEHTIHQQIDGLILPKDSPECLAEDEVYAGSTNYMTLMGTWQVIGLCGIRSYDGAQIVPPDDRYYLVQCISEG